MARILVSGATGFVGRHLTDLLASREHVLTVLSRQPDHVVRNRQLFPHLEHVLLDDLSEGSSHFKHDVIVHLAGLAEVRRPADIEISSALSTSNIELTARLVQFALRSDVSKFIHMSSVLAVTANKSDFTIDDDCESAPDTEYGRSKLGAEHHVHQFAEAGRLGISLRPPMVIGPDAKGNWGRLIRLSSSNMPLPLGGLANRRSLISIETLCDAVIHLIEREFGTAASGQYAISDIPAVSVRDMVARLRQGMGRPQRLVRIPTAVLETALICAGMKRRVDSITGDLVVDPCRFFERFSFQPRWDAHQAIIACGRQAELLVTSRGTKD